MEALLEVWLDSQSLVFVFVPGDPCHDWLVIDRMVQSCAMRRRSSFELFWKPNQASGSIGTRLEEAALKI